MRTLELARIALCQPVDSPAADVLKAAQDEVSRLSDAVVRAKNVQQRNGAKKKLGELNPLMPLLEIEVSLTEYERVTSQDSPATASERATARVQAQKLAAQISALPPSDEKDVFQQWLMDLTTIAPAPVTPAAPQPLATNPPPPPSPAPEVAPPVKIIQTDPPPLPASTTPPPVPVRTGPQPVDPTIQLFAVLTAAEKQANARPLVVTPTLLRDLEMLRTRIGTLPGGPARAELQERSEALTAVLQKKQPESAPASEAVAKLEHTANEPTANIQAVRAECDRLAATLNSSPASAENKELLGRLDQVKRTILERVEMVEIETAIQSCLTQKEKDPANPALRANIDQVSARIQRLTNAAAKASLAARIDQLLKGLDQSKFEVKIAKALDSLKRESATESAAPSTLQAALKSISTQVNQLSPGTARTDFEKQIRDLGEQFGKLNSQPSTNLTVATVLRLEPIPGRSPASARPLLFVARDRFSIGRKPDTEAPRADLLTPSAEPRISRVHVTFLARSGKVHVLAGEEGKPSTNPAVLDETPLSSTPLAINFQTERQIDLTGVLVLLVKQLPSAAPYGPPLHEGHPHAVVGSTMLMPPISGCLRIRPQNEDKLPNLAVWIFTDATIGAAPTCAITLPQPKLAPELARIHYWKKSFWIETLKSGSAVELGGHPLETGASQSLSSGQELRLGDAYYKLKLS